VIRQSESISKLAVALVAAQAEMTNAPKETKGQVGSAVRYYTDLPTLTDLVRPILSKHGLAYVQLPGDAVLGASQVSLTTRLIHDSGEWIEDNYSMPAGQGAQGVGSALTYARRYALMALLGIAADDDDGAAASTPKARKPAVAPVFVGKASPGGKAISDAQVSKIQILLKENWIASRDAALAYYEHIAGRAVTSSKDLTAAEGSAVIEALTERLQSLPT
jgi:hypothetical protein